MEEILFEYRTEITRVVELTATITGIVLFKKYKYTHAKYFIYFLIYLSFGDFVSTYTHHVKYDGFLNFLEGTVLEKNYWWSTLFWKVGAILFFAYYYNKILTTKKFKLIIKVIGLIFLVFSIIYIVLNWDDYFIRFFPSINIFGACVIFFCTVFYFIEVLRSNKILIFYKSLNFYISFAIFIWWLIITPIVFFDIYLINRDFEYIRLRYLIYLIANIIMYSTFTFALIFCKPDKTGIN